MISSTSLDLRPSEVFRSIFHPHFFPYLLAFNLPHRPPRTTNRVVAKPAPLPFCHFCRSGLPTITQLPRSQLYLMLPSSRPLSARQIMPLTSWNSLVSAAISFFPCRCCRIEPATPRDRDGYHRRRTLSPKFESSHRFLPARPVFPPE